MFYAHGDCCTLKPIMYTFFSILHVLPAVLFHHGAPRRLDQETQGVKPHELLPYVTNALWENFAQDPVIARPGVPRIVFRRFYVCIALSLFVACEQP
jgi:hypothetical protein